MGMGGGQDAPKPTAPAVRPLRRRFMLREEYGARALAVRILEAARDEARAIEAAARDAHGRALELAVAEGRRAGEAKAQQLYLRAQALAAARLDGAQHDAVELAVRIAEKLIGRALELEPALVAEVCAEALRGVRAEGRVKLRVHPADAPLLTPRLIELVGRQLTVEVVSSAEVERHGCIIDSALGTTDGRLSTQLEVVRDALVQAAHEQT